MIILKPNRTLSGIYFERIRILQFKSPVGLIDDEDIIDLFLGLVRLIKRNTELEVEEKYISKIRLLSSEIDRLNKVIENN